MSTSASGFYRVQDAPKVFGKLTVLKFYDSAPKDSKDRKSMFFEAKFTTDSFQAKDVMKLQKGDEVFIAGRLEDVPWQKGEGSTLTYQWPDVQIPWYVRERDMAASKAAPAKPAQRSAKQEDVNLDDIPFD